MDDKGRAKNRPDRIPLHKRKILTANERKGYRRRIVNDSPGRIQACLDAGYTFVESNENTADKTVATPSDLGSSNTRYIVNKDPKAATQYGYLMEIPDDYYLEDQKDKQKVIDERERAYNPKKFEDSDENEFFGEIKRTYS